jgi:hypothetical protein
VFPREEPREILTETVEKIGRGGSGWKAWMWLGVAVAAVLGFYLALRAGDVPEPITPRPAGAADPSDQPLPAPELNERSSRQLATPVARPARDKKPEPPSGTALFGVEGPAGATVAIDGEKIGELPLTARRIPAGLHTITIALPGGEPQSFAIELKANEKRVEIVEANRESGTLRHERKGGDRDE